MKMVEFKMTVDEFFDKLCSQESPNGWFLRPIDEDHPLDYRLRIMIDGKVCCPITAVYLRETGNHLYPHDWALAAESLGLEMAEEIKNAADSQYGPGKLRNQMIEITQPITLQTETEFDEVDSTV